MLNWFGKAFFPLNTNLQVKCFLKCSPPWVIFQSRNTYILKRRWPPGLAKQGHRPLLRGRHFVYDLVEDTNIRKRNNIDVILTTYVAGHGQQGDRISINSNYAYYHLLLPGRALYVSPDNASVYEELESSEIRQTSFSSPTAERIVQILSRYTLSVVMNKEAVWELQPWHVRASFRKAGITVPESAIAIPVLPIRGPDINLEGKEFFVNVTVNGREPVAVRCRLHHWSTHVADRLPFVEKFWEQPVESILPPVSSEA